MRVTRVRIAAASAALSLHPQTLRKYEKAGLLRPARQGSARSYTEADIERLALIKHLADVRGINVAGLVLALTVHDELSQLLAEMRAGEFEESSRLTMRRLQDLLARYMAAE